MTTPRHAITTKPVLLEIPGMAAVRRRPESFSGADGEPLPFEIYHPAGITTPVPMVVIVEGYPDPGFAAFLGCRFMEMDWSTSLARLIAASGMAAVTYANREPLADLNALLDHLAANAAALGVDADRLGLWGTSGHAPLALAVLHRATCAVLSNPYTCDAGGATHVADAARTFKFVAPGCAQLPRNPLYVIRSGKDEMPGLNASLDLFVARALALNLPITVVNHPDATHSFDIFHDSELTRSILTQALTFLVGVA